MNAQQIIGCVFALIVAFVPPRDAQATLIVDTGTPVAWPDPQGDPILDAQLWFAAQFTLAVSSRIDEITGYLSSGNGGAIGGTFSVTLYSDASVLPADLLFVAQATAPALTFDENGNAVPGWHRPTGLNWALNPGQYWVAFEVRPRDTFSGFMANPASNALEHEAFGTDPSGWNTPSPGNGGFPDQRIGLGLRVYASAVSVS